MEKLKKAGLWFRKTIPKVIPDVLASAGAGAVSVGSFLICTPAGWIVTGVLLIAAAVIWSKGGGAD